MYPLACSRSSASQSCGFHARNSQKLGNSLQNRPESEQNALKGATLLRCPAAQEQARNKLATCKKRRGPDVHLISQPILSLTASTAIKALC